MSKILGDDPFAAEGGNKDEGPEEKKPGRKASSAPARPAATRAPAGKKAAAGPEPRASKAPGKRATTAPPETPAQKRAATKAPATKAAAEERASATKAPAAKRAATKAPAEKKAPSKAPASKKASEVSKAPAEKKADPSKAPAAKAAAAPVSDLPSAEAPAEAPAAAEPTAAKASAAAAAEPTAGKGAAPARGSSSAKTAAEAPAAAEPTAGKGAAPAAAEPTAAKAATPSSSDSPSTKAAVEAPAAAEPTAAKASAPASEMPSAQGAAGASAPPPAEAAAPPVSEAPAARTAAASPAAGAAPAAAPGSAPRAAGAVFVETIEVLSSAADGVSAIVDAVLIAAPAAEPPSPAPPRAAAEPARAAAEEPSREPPRASPGEAGALVLVPPAPAAAPRERRHKPLSALGRRYRDLALRGRATVVDDFGLDAQAIERYAPALGWLYERYFRVETEGLEHVPDSGRALLVANRAGTLPWDSLMLGHALRSEHAMRRPLRPLLEDDAFHAPYLGALLQRLGAVRACQENAERLLATDQLALVFPEGQKGSGKRFAERYQLQRFGRGGFVKLALRTRTPILPVAIVGAEEAQPLLGKLGWLGRPLGLSHLPLTPTFPWLGPVGLLPLPSKWHIAIGEPLHLYAEYDPAAADDMGLALRLAEQVRSRIQDMLGGLLRRRRSPFSLGEALRGATPGAAPGVERGRR